MYSGLNKINTRRNGADEAEVLAALKPAFLLTPPCEVAGTNTSPLIFASPHSGCNYPQAWVKACTLNLLELRQAEDAFIDLLFSSAPDHGAPLLAAQFPRSFVDVNRASDELPPSWLGAQENPTPRVSAGLGVIPMTLGENMPIYKIFPSMEAGLARMELYHAYHATLQELIAQAKDSFGKAVLIDCHSMPGFGPQNARRADFILGDRYGRSCEPALVDRVGHYLKSHGYSVMRNYPYAGGYVTEHYGQPDDDVHVLQIEINRDLYLNHIAMRKSAGFGRLQIHMDGLIKLLCEAYISEIKIAAE